MFPLEFRAEVNHDETSYGAILQQRLRYRSLSRSDMIPDCDGRTERRTDGGNLS